MSHGPLSSEELNTCLDLLQRISDNFRVMPHNQRLQSLISKISSLSHQRLQEVKNDKRTLQRQQDRALLAATQLVQAQRDSQVPLLEASQEQSESSGQLHNPEYCYVCKKPYREVHFFYHYLCPACADYNYRMRTLRADLSGRVALVTGGRVKIGFQLVLRLLRDGARVILTTRFPHAAARRFTRRQIFPSGASDSRSTA